MTEKLTMQANIRTFSILIVSALTLLLAGCPIVQEPLEVVFKPDSAEQNQGPFMQKRFKEAPPSGKTAVDSAVELAKSNEELFKKMAAMQQGTQDMIAENRTLKDRIAVLEPELEQVKKELDEANDLLIDMTTELNNWKMQILGFQEEMRDADTEQLRALLKILKVLGGEIDTEALHSQDQNSPAVSLNKQSDSQLTETYSLSESNE
jgi:predicted RNase H-like nuclease (RuvC/YqgF family)